MKTIKYLLAGALLLGTAAPTFAQDDNKTAIEHLTSVIKSKPADLADQMKKAQKEYKKNPEVLTGIGRAFLAQKDTAQAKHFADLALARNNKYAPAWVLMGDIEVVKDNPGEAATDYQNAIYFDPKDPQAYYKYAMVQRGVNPEMATSILEKLRQERPDYPVDQLIGHIYYNAQDFSKAAEAYGKVADPMTMDDDNITEYGIATWLLGQRDKSIEICKKALEKNPRKAAWNRLVFYNYTDQKKGNEALEYADRLFNQSDSAHISGEDLIYNGTALNLVKKYDEAIAAFQKAAEHKDNAGRLGTIYKNISDSYLGKEDYDNAVAYFKKSIEGSEKPSVDDLDNFGTLYTDIAAKKTHAGDHEGAAAAFKAANDVYLKMAELYPNHKTYCDFMCGQIQANLDPDSKAGLAKPYYESLSNALGSKTELNSSEKAMLTQAYTYLMVYYFNVAQNKAQAKVYAEKMLQVDPENEVAKQVIEVVK